MEPASLYFEPHLQSKYLVNLIIQLIETYRGKDTCRIARLFADAHQYFSSYALEKSKILIRHIRENYSCKLTLDELAKVALMDKYTMSKVFKKATNQTIVQYINSYRCKKVSEYISDGLSISEAAQKCGFTNMSYFTKTFKTYMGCLPSKYCSH